MSILSLLFARNVAEIMPLWDAADFNASNIVFGDGTTSAMRSGTMVYHGMAFQYDLKPVSRVDGDHYIFCNDDAAAFRSALHLRLGSAVASGRGVPCVILALLQLGAVLGEQLNAAAAQWHPAAIVSGFDYYREAVGQYANGAAFPALLCVGFDTTQPYTVRTRGLKWLSGQELVFDHPNMPRGHAMRYVVRLVHDIATQGAVDAAIDVPGLHAGETVRLSPDIQNDMLLAQLV